MLPGENEEDVFTEKEIKEKVKQSLVYKIGEKLVRDQSAAAINER